MHSITLLPKITMSQLQKKVLSTHSPSAIRLSQISPEKDVAKDIIVTSPFYDKINIKHHHQKCQCQYHRMKKYQEGIPKIRVSNQMAANIDKGSKKQQNLRGWEQSKHSPEDKSERMSRFRCQVNILNPLQNRKSTLKKPDLLSEKDRNAKTMTIHCKLPSFVNNKQNTKTQPNIKITAKKTMNVFNNEFMSTLSQRLLNNKFKQKYLKRLFRYISTRVQQNKHYIYQSRAYIQNSLNVLLNHFNMEVLVSDQLSEQQKVKIAYHMMCQLDKVSPVLQDLKQVLEDMEKFQQQQKIKDQQRKKTLRYLQTTRRLKTLPNDNEIEQRVSDQNGDKVNIHEKSNKQGYHYENMTQKQRQVYMNATISFGERDQKNLNVFRDTFQAVRKSNRNVNYQAPHRIKNYQNRENPSNRSSFSINKKNRTSNRNSTNFHSTHKATSPRSTVLVKVQQKHEQQVDNRFMNTKKLQKKIKGRKGKVMTKKIIVDEFDPKYNSIPYQKYCNKGQFKFLIGQIQRLDRNDVQRADTAYKILKVQKMLQTPQRIDQLLDDFNPLIHEGCKQEILKHLTAVKDKRHIDKLIKQMDYMLNYVKKNDPRNYLDNQDLFPYKEDPTLRQPKQQIRIHKYRGVEAQRHSVTTTKLIDYRAHQKIQKHKTTQEQQKRQLEQKGLPLVKTESTCPDITEHIKHKTIMTQKVLIPKEVVVVNVDQNQRKVLQYMHKNYNKTFRYLNTQLTQFCSSLPRQQQEEV